MKQDINHEAKARVNKVIRETQKFEELIEEPIWARNTAKHYTLVRFYVWGVDPEGKKVHLGFFSTQEECAEALKAFEDNL